MMKIKQILINYKYYLKMLGKSFVIICIFYITFFKIFGLTRINNISMRPSIGPGSLLLYYRLNNNYEVGDLITFTKDNKRYVLRVIGTSNDIISINLNGEFINSNRKELPKEYSKNRVSNDISYPYKVGSNKVFVVGDNREEVDDSRVFGSIDVNIIDGKVIGLLKTKDL